MKMLFAAAALAAFATSANAEPKTMTADGQQFRYEATQVDGYQVVSGTNLTTGEDFVLRERKGRVIGHYANQPVRYTVSAKAPIKLASR